MDPYSWLCAASLFFTVISDGSRFETKCRQSSITYRHNHRVTDVRRVPPLNKTDSSRCDLYAGLGQIALKCQFLLLKKKKNTNQLDYKKKRSFNLNTFGLFLRRRVQPFYCGDWVGTKPGPRRDQHRAPDLNPIQHLWLWTGTSSQSL